MKKIVAGGFLGLVGAIWKSSIVISIGDFLSYESGFMGRFLESVFTSGKGFSYLCAVAILIIGIVLIIKGLLEKE